MTKTAVLGMLFTFALGWLVSGLLGGQQTVDGTDAPKTSQDEECAPYLSEEIISGVHCWSRYISYPMYLVKPDGGDLYSTGKDNLLYLVHNGGLNNQLNFIHSIQHNGQSRRLGDVIDAESWERLKGVFKDKNNVYCYYLNSNGGHLIILDELDANKTFNMEAYEGNDDNILRAIFIANDRRPEGNSVTDGVYFVNHRCSVSNVDAVPAQ